MVCWMCASLSFWGAAALLGLLAALHAICVTRGARRHPWREGRHHVGQPAR